MKHKGKYITNKITDGLQSTIEITFFNGGLDRINSNITACASFLTLGGISPFTITLRRLYFLNRL